jgi:predicted GNAT family acetyltransferase
MADEPATVRISDNRARHRYEAHVDGVLAAYATYELAPGRIVFRHTQTEPAFEGHGVGSALAEAALDDVRARGLLVIPQCPFFASYIARHPEFADLVGHAH